MNRRFAIVSIAIVAAIVVLAAVYASSHPDGLERVAEQLGFISQATEEPVFAAPLPDYSTDAIKSPFWSTSVAGLIGAALVFIVVVLIGRLFRKR